MLQAVLLICMQGAEGGDIDPVLPGRLQDGLPFFRLDFLSVNGQTQEAVKGLFVSPLISVPPLCARMSC